MGQKNLHFKGLGPRNVLLAGLIGILVTSGVAQAVGPAAMVGRYTFYNNSFHDGFNPGIDAAPIAGADNDDSDAIDPTKAPLLHGRGPATFANWTGCTNGITGLAYDIANHSVLPTGAEFYFATIGKDGDAAPIAVVPSAMAVLPGAGASGSTRVVFTFPAGAVKSTWLQVTIDTTFGLPAPDVHYWGNAAGDTGSTMGTAILVDVIDEQAINNHPWPNPLYPVVPGPIPVDWHWNINKDADMNATDILLCRTHATTPFTAVRVIDRTEPASVVGRRMFYNYSYYDGRKTGIDPLPISGTNNDDADAIDPNKTPLLPGDGMAVFANWTGSVNGISGLVYDFAATHRDPVASDFQFHLIGKDGSIPPSAANQFGPAEFVVQDLGGIKRVFLTPGSAVRNGWVQVTIGVQFGLPAPDVHYWGSVVADCGAGNPPPYILVNATDEIDVRNHRPIHFSRVPVEYAWDVDKDSLVNATDEIMARNNPSSVFNCVKMITR